MVFLLLKPKPSPSPSPDDDEQTTLAMTITSSDGIVENRYKLLDIDSNIFEWNRKENGKIVFDKEIIWDFDNKLKAIENISENSFDAIMENGNTVRIFNINSNEKKTTCNIINEANDTVNISIIFDKAFDLSLIAKNYGSNTKNPAAVAKIIYKVVVVVVGVIAGISAVKCESGIAKAAKECESHSQCRAIKHTCSVTCTNRTAGSDYDCSKHNWNG